jgi:hypothetical protein
MPKPGKGVILSNPKNDVPVVRAAVCASKPANALKITYKRGNCRILASIVCKNKYKLKNDLCVLKKVAAIKPPVSVSVPVPVGSGLAALHFNFSNSRNGTILDLSGNNNSGTLKGGAKIVNASLKLSGNKSFVLVDSDNSLDIKDELTLAAQVNLSSYQEMMIINKFWHDYGIGINIKGQFFVTYRNQANRLVRVVSNIIKLNKTTHLAATINAYEKTVALYINGKLVKKAPFNGTSIQNLNKNIQIGAGGNGKKYFFKGEINNVMIYDSAFTAGEIAGLMHMPLLKPVKVKVKVKAKVTTKREIKEIKKSCSKAGMFSRNRTKVCKLTTKGHYSPANDMKQYRCQNKPKGAARFQYAAGNVNKTCVILSIQSCKRGYSLKAKKCVKK